MLTSLSARVRGAQLDRELARGVEPWRSPMHSARSLQITSPRARRSLAQCYEQLLARAATPTRSLGFSAVVPTDRGAVLQAQNEIQAIVARLLDDRPISSQGVADLRDLITDGAGPIYTSRGGDALSGMLRAMLVRLDIPT